MKNFILGFIFNMVLKVIQGASQTFTKASRVTYSRFQRFAAESRGEMSTGFIIGAIVTVVLGVILFLAFKDTLIPLMLDKLKGKIDQVD